MARGRRMATDACSMLVLCATPFDRSEPVSVLSTKIDQTRQPAKHLRTRGRSKLLTAGRRS
eukprot:9491293-Prorocentrum_lima.AAC.1